MKKLIGAIVIVLVISMLSSCSKAAPASTGTITACIGQEPGSIDPALNVTADGAAYISNCFEGLTKVAKNLSIVPGIAQSMPSVSADGLTYTYKLRTDAKWSDGKAVTAADFVYAWQRAVDPDTGAQAAYELFEIKNAQEISSQFVVNGKPAKAKYDEATKSFVTNKDGSYIEDEANGRYVETNPDGSPVWLSDLGVKAVDAHTLVVTLTAPCTYWSQITSLPTLFPVRKDIVEKNPDSWAKSPATYIGDGPLMLKSWSHNSEMVFTKNPYYYDGKEITSDTLDYKLMTDNGTALAAFKSGSLDIVQSMVPTDEIQSLIKSGDCLVKPQLANEYITLNTTKAPLNTLLVRQALALSIDRSYIVDKIQKAGDTAAGAFVPYGFSDASLGTDFRKVGGNYIDPSESAFAKNVAQAKKDLAQAGYPGGKGFPVLEYKYNISGPNEPMAEYIANAWKTNLGISVNLVSEDFKTMNEDKMSGNFEVARESWSPDYDDPMTFLNVFAADSGENDTGFSNADYDRLIAEAQSTGDQTVRMRDMHQAEGILMAQMPVIPVSFYTDPLLVGKNITGYVDSPMGYLYLMWASVK